MYVYKSTRETEELLSPTSSQLNKCHLTKKAESLEFAVKSLSQACLFVTLWTAADQALLPFSISWNLLSFMRIELMILFHSLPSPSPPVLSLFQYQGLFQ